MKNRVGIICIVALSFLIMSSVSTSKQGAGIVFENMTLAEAKVESQKSGKLIFIDCYTDWCGPCKRMAATSFKDDEVGRIFNKKFINLKVEMEKNSDGAELARLYRVRAYPTLLIIDGKGNLVKQVVGMQDKNGLIAMASSVQ